MRINKLFGARSITNLLYGLLMFLPFMAVLGRVIYTQSNPNAKDSYTGSVSYLNTVSFNQYIDNKPVNATTYELNNTTYYYYSSTSFSNYSLEVEHANQDLGSTGGYVFFNCVELTFNNTLYTNIKSAVVAPKNANHIVKMYDIQLNDNYFYINNELCYLDVSTTITPIYQTAEIYNSKFYVNASLTTSTIYVNVLNSSTNKMMKNAYFDLYLNDNTLSNAFEYSLDMFINNNANLNNINFFGWFDGIFLNQSNTHNMLYLNFANWYMNYALLVSSGYLLFLALMWFINYVRRILDKSQNIDFGGF